MFANRCTTALFTQVSLAIVLANRCTNFHTEFPSYAFTILGITISRFFAMGALKPKPLPVVNLMESRICVEYDPTKLRELADTARHHALLKCYKCYMILRFKYKFSV